MISFSFAEPTRKPYPNFTLISLNYFNTILPFIFHLPVTVYPGDVTMILPQKYCTFIRKHSFNRRVFNVSHTSLEYLNFCLNLKLNLYALLSAYDLNILRIKNTKQSSNNILRRNTPESIMEDNLERGKYFKTKKVISYLFFKFPKIILCTRVVILRL